MSATSRYALRVAALTHVGRRRYANEDCVAVGPRILDEHGEQPWLAAHDLSSPCTCLIADGMGGHPAGDLASRMVIEYLSARLPEAISADDRLVHVLRGANQALFDAMKRDPTVFGMGTTIAGVAASHDEIVIFNVGDSRVYRIDDQRLTQLSFDDATAVAGTFSSLDLPVRMLSQCLGGFPDVEDIAPHVVRHPTVPGGTYLICSDGLHDMLSDAAIEACLARDLEHAVLTLFERAMDEGGNDNISIILARVEEAGQP
jgi:serine/threonine protein phosphatase PrpC